MTPNSERKPLLKKKPSGKFVMHDFQRDDLMRLAEQNSSANWSELSRWDVFQAQLA